MQESILQRNNFVCRCEVIIIYMYDECASLVTILQNVVFKGNLENNFNFKFLILLYGRF